MFKNKSARWYRERLPLTCFEEDDYKEEAERFLLTAHHGCGVVCQRGDLLGQPMDGSVAGLRAHREHVSCRSFAASTDSVPTGSYSQSFSGTPPAACSCATADSYAAIAGAAAKAPGFRRHGSSQTARPWISVYHRSSVSTRGAVGTSESLTTLVMRSFRSVSMAT
jgi:hypothetical protein